MILLNADGRYMKKMSVQVQINLKIYLLSLNFLLELSLYSKIYVRLFRSPPYMVIIVVFILTWIRLKLAGMQLQFKLKILVMKIHHMQ